MPVSIRFLGTAAFQITTANGKRILIDPYLDENPVSPVKVADLDRLDLLLVTHAAYDHLGDTEAILRRFPGLPLICGADVRYAIPCHHDDPALPEIVRFKELLSEGCQADENAPKPVILSPGESLILHSGL